jgi:hypothetical protein
VLGVLLAELYARGGASLRCGICSGRTSPCGSRCRCSASSRALAALAASVDNVPAVEGRAKGTITVRGSGLFSYAGRIAGAGKASAPLLFLHYVAQALCDGADDDDDEDAAVHLDIAPILTCMVSTACAGQRSLAVTTCRALGRAHAERGGSGGRRELHGRG